MKEHAERVWSEDIDDAMEWRTVIDDDLHMARQALAEDNAPGVERAIARLEATLIQIENDPDAGFVEAPLSIISDGSDRLRVDHPKPAQAIELTQTLAAEDDVPLVDLTGLPPEEEE